MRWAARSFPPAPAIPNRPCRRSQQLKPNAYAGPPDFLKILLDKARVRGRRRLLDHARRSSPAPRCRRACAPNWKARGVKTRQAFATAELGVIAYETDGARRRAGARALQSTRTSGSKSCAPAAAIPLPIGGVGEIVVTALRGNFPLLRFATGDLSALSGRDAHSRLDGPRRPDDQGQGHVRAPERSRRDRQAPSRTRNARGSSSAARANRTR